MSPRSMRRSVIKNTIFERAFRQCGRGTRSRSRSRAMIGTLREYGRLNDARDRNAADHTRNSRRAARRNPCARNSSSGGMRQQACNRVVARKKPYMAAWIAYARPRFAASTASVRSSGLFVLGCPHIKLNHPVMMYFSSVGETMPRWWCVQSTGQISVRPFFG